MEYYRESNGWQTFWEHFQLPALSAFFFGSMFFSNLYGQLWIDVFIADMVLLAVGAALICYAKIPVYRNGQFFTFGLKSVPKRLAGFYRWGWGLFLSGMALSFLFSLSRQ